MIVVREAQASDKRLAAAAVELLAEAARTSHVLVRDEATLASALGDSRAAIAVTEGRLIGFAYLTVCADQWVAYSGFVVAPESRGQGVGRRLALTLERVVDSKTPRRPRFALTTSAAMRRLLTRLGFRKTALGGLTRDERFWRACYACPLAGAAIRPKREHGRERLCCCDAYARSHSPEAGGGIATAS